MSENSPGSAAVESAAGADWQSTIAEFAATRIELIRIESQDAARTAAQKTREVVLLVGAGLLGWLCLLAGLIGALHHLTSWPWWAIALALGVMHVMIALRFAALLKRPSTPAFPLTRAEFHKDRLWMQSLKKPNSKH